LRAAAVLAVAVTEVDFAERFEGSLDLDSGCYRDYGLDCCIDYGYDVVVGFG
jgi:hypothetical protein